MFFPSKWLQGNKERNKTCRTISISCYKNFLIQFHDNMSHPTYIISQVLITLCADMSPYLCIVENGNPLNILWACLHLAHRTENHMGIMGYEVIFTTKKYVLLSQQSW